MPHLPDDSDLLQRWNYFRANYASLGYHRASYEYFAVWQEREHSNQFDADEIERRVREARKRLHLGERPDASEP